jgi:hypothetical protein
MCPPCWFRPSFVKRNKAALSWYPSRLKLFGGLPSFQNQIHLLNHERRYLASRALRPELLREIRYPYLDRDLLEFACAIPREQLVGVGKRRFLMKRALVGIVPDEILNRKRRAPVTQKLEGETSTGWPSSAEIGNHIISSSLGIVDPNLFLQALKKARFKKEVSADSLRCTLILESWLRQLAIQGVLTMTSLPRKDQGYSPVQAKELPSHIHRKEFS